MKLPWNYLLTNPTHTHTHTHIYIYIYIYINHIYINEITLALFINKSPPYIYIYKCVQTND